MIQQQQKTKDAEICKGSLIKITEMGQYQDCNAVITFMPAKNLRGEMITNHYMVRIVEQYSKDESGWIKLEGNEVAVHDGEVLF